MRLNLSKCCLGPTYWARVKWLEHGAGHPDHTCSFSSLDAGSVGFEGTRSAESRSTLGKKGQRSSAIATTAGVFYARTHTRTRAPVAAIREALDIRDFEAGLYVESV